MGPMAGQGDVSSEAPLGTDTAFPLGGRKFGLRHSRGALSGPWGWEAGTGGPRHGGEKELVPSSGWLSAPDRGVGEAE